MTVTVTEELELELRRRGKRRKELLVAVRATVKRTEKLMTNLGNTKMTEIRRETRPRGGRRKPKGERSGSLNFSEILSLRRFSE